MVYAYDQWVPLPTKDLYDTQLMLASINAAKDMYDKAEKKMDDFNTKYGDFYSPIKKDMDWWGQNVTGFVRDKINAAYANGIDPLRSPQGRAFLSNITNSLPYSDMAKVKQSAKEAEKYLDAVQKLQISGLYNPDIEKYEGKSLGEFSTIGDGQNPGDGIWTRLSPTPYENLGKFSEDYFKNVKPNSKDISRNGRRVAVSEVTEQQLRAIAEQHFNDLVNTPQGRLMYMRELDRAGGNAELARQNFNNEIYNANKQREFRNETYDDNYFERAKLALQRQVVQWKKNMYEEQKRGNRGKDEKPGTNISTDMMNTGMLMMFGKSSIGKITGVSSPTQLADPRYREFVEQNFGKAQAENISRYITPAKTTGQYIRFKTASGKMSNRYQIKAVHDKNGRFVKFDWAGGRAPVDAHGKVPVSRFIDAKGNPNSKYNVVVERDRQNALENYDTLHSQIEKFANAHTYQIPSGILGGYYGSNNKLGSIGIDDSSIAHVYSIDDVVMSASGANRTRSEVQKGKQLTNELRENLKGLKVSNGQKVSIVGTDKAITLADRHGVVRNYVLCVAYDERKSSQIDKNVDTSGAKTFLVQLPQKTQKLAGYGITSDRISTSLDDTGSYSLRTYADNDIMGQLGFSASPIKRDPMMDSYDIVTNTTYNPAILNSW